MELLHCYLHKSHKLHKGNFYSCINPVRSLSLAKYQIVLNRICYHKLNMHEILFCKVTTGLSAVESLLISWNLQEKNNVIFNDFM